MVRRRVGLGLAVLQQEDHHVQIASIAIDLGKRPPFTLLH
jgi:hypothetical protein